MEKIVKNFVIILIIFSTIFLSSCSLTKEKDNEILSLKDTIKTQQKEIEKLEKRQELKEKIEHIKNNAHKKKEAKFKKEIKNLKSQISNNLQEKQVLNFEKQKELNIKFYSQFPLDIATWKKYEEPYQNFCEEASLLNWYYYLTWKEKDLKEYNKDLLKLKELEDLLFEWWYKHTNIEDTLKLLIAFQWDNQQAFWEIIENPTVEDIKYNISIWNPVLVPVYWKWLSNNLFVGWWPVYHNLLIKWYTEQNFIVNEVWVSKWDWYNYKIEELMKNIADYDKKLYPDNFLQWKKKILILYK